MSVIFWVVFAAAAIFIGMRFFRISRMTGKVFDAAERELDRRLSDEAYPDQPRLVECEHCGTRVPAADESCPKCGAPLP